MLMRICAVSVSPALVRSTWSIFISHSAIGAGGAFGVPGAGVVAAGGAAGSVRAIIAGAGTGVLAGALTAAGGGNGCGAGCDCRNQIAPPTMAITITAKMR